MNNTNATLEQRAAIAYYRVSTQSQGATGYGLEAQRSDVARFLSAHPTMALIDSFTEIESGRHDKRPELERAMGRARDTGATLIVAKLDRLSRNMAFTCGLRDAGVDFVCCDMPDANRLTIGILAAVAENESDAIRSRTKKAIAAAQARGVKWGQAGKNHTEAHFVKMRAASALARDKAALSRKLALFPTVRDAFRATNSNYTHTAAALNGAAVKSPGGKGRWFAHTVKSVLELI